MKQIKALVVAAACLATVVNVSAVPYLFEVATKIDGTINDDPYGGGSVPPFAIGGTGLGTAAFAIGGAGGHFFGIFFDHEIDETLYTSELGSAVGAPGAGQSWEIDEPQLFGDIYANFASGTLDNAVGVAAPDDVAMALGWNFVLTGTELASISITASETDPGAGFRLRQHNTVGGNDIFLFGTLTINDPGVPGVPEGGATFVTLLFALAGLSGLKLKLR